MSITKRVDRLEREVRLYRGGVALMLLLIVATLTLGLTGRDVVPDVIEAKAFHVVNDDGRPLVKLEQLEGTTTDGLGSIGAVSTLNDKGKEVVVIAATRGGQGVVGTTDGNGQLLVALRATSLGTGTVETMNNKGKRLVTLSSNPAGTSGFLATMNGSALEAVVLTTTPRGEGVIYTTSAVGRPLVYLTATDEGEGTLTTMNSDGRELAVIGAHNDLGAMCVYDPNGENSPTFLIPGK